MAAAHNFWPGQATQEQRRQARKHIQIEHVGITQATLERYYTAVGRLAPELQDVATEGALDETIALWSQNEFEDGTPLHLVGDALSVVHPRFRRILSLRWPGGAYQFDELLMSALNLLGFHALLRTGELLQIRPCDFILDDKRGLLSLPSSKSGVRNNSRESVSLHDGSTLETVRAMLELKYQLGLPVGNTVGRLSATFSAEPWKPFKYSILGLDPTPCDEEELHMKCKVMGFWSVHLSVDAGVTVTSPDYISAMVWRYFHLCL